MSATGYDIQKYIYCMEKVKKNSLTNTINGDKISLFSEDKLILGSFENIDDLFEFLCGYEYGYDKGKAEGITFGMEQVSMEMAELDEYDLCEE